MEDAEIRKHVGGEWHSALSGCRTVGLGVSSFLLSLSLRKEGIVQGSMRTNRVTRGDSQDQSLP
jgi:hypothetical protein